VPSLYAVLLVLWERFIPHLHGWPSTLLHTWFTSKAMRQGPRRLRSLLFEERDDVQLQQAIRRGLRS
jgi:hypothetical protein